MAEKNSTGTEGDKIDPGAEGDKGGKVALPDFDETDPSSYNVEVQRLLCKRLELLCLQLEIDNRESAHERQQRRKIDASEHEQRRKIGFVVAVVAGMVPVVALAILFFVMLCSPEKFSGGMSAMVLIFASFSSMVVIYAFLIRGMFPGIIQKNDTNDTHPAVDETLKAVRSVLSGKE